MAERGHVSSSAEAAARAINVAVAEQLSTMKGDAPHLPEFACVVTEVDGANAVFAWSAKIDGVQVNRKVRQSFERVRERGVDFPWPNPREALITFEAARRMAAEAPSLSRLEGEFVCKFVGAVSSNRPDDVIWNPFLWDAEVPSQALLLFFWSDAQPPHNEFRAHYVLDFSKGLMPPGNIWSLRRSETQEEEESTEEEHETTQERAMWDNYFERANSLEPLIDVTQFGAEGEE